MALIPKSIQGSNKKNRPSIDRKINGKNKPMGVYTTIYKKFGYGFYFLFSEQGMMMIIIMG